MKIKGKVLWQAWLNMKARCEPDFHQAKDYHARGIAIDPAWLYYPQFYEDMEAAWQPGLILDREDNDKGYSKDNCRWVTKRVSQINRRVTRLTLEQINEVRPLRRTTRLTETQIGERFGVPRHVIADVFRGDRECSKA